MFVDVIILHLATALAAVRKGICQIPPEGSFFECEPIRRYGPVKSVDHRIARGRSEMVICESDGGDKHLETMPFLWLGELRHRSDDR